MHFPGFRLPDELLALREQIRRVVRDEVIPVEQRIDPDAPELPDDDYQKISAKTKAAGLWALGAPEQYGGGGLDTFSMCVALEEMSQHRMGLYNPGCGVFGRYPPPAIWAGSKEQIAKYAVPTIRDGLKTFFAITEPSGGSDPAGAIQTRAEKRGDRWVLNGRKVFTSRAHDAPWGLVWARTDKAKGRGGISCFILERGTPGFTARPIKVIRTSAIPNDVTWRTARSRREPRRRRGAGARSRLRAAREKPLPVFGVEPRRRRRRASHARSRQAARHLRRAALPAPGDPVDARRQRGRAARLPLDHLGGGLEGRPRRGCAGRGSIAKLTRARRSGRVIDSAVQITAPTVSQGIPARARYREARVPASAKARPRSTAW